MANRNFCKDPIKTQPQRGNENRFLREKSTPTKSGIFKLGKNEFTNGRKSEKIYFVLNVC